MRLRFQQGTCPRLQERGELVIQKHNEIRDAVGDLASLAWGSVRREPVIRDTDYANNQPALVGDLGDVRGVWEPQTEALFDIYVSHRH